jgi:hypothetical protein
MPLCTRAWSHARRDRACSEACRGQGKRSAAGCTLPEDHTGKPSLSLGGTVLNAAYCLCICDAVHVHNCRLCLRFPGLCIPALLMVDEGEARWECRHQIAT